jgi:hypothetical protein
MLRERSETRMLCADLVEIRWKDESGKIQKATALLEDISPSGACVQLETAIAVGTVVQIRHPKGLLVGRVKYCVYRDIGYFIGMQFNPNSKWSKREFAPQHLLDVNRLLGRAIRGTAKRLKSDTVH